MEDIKFWFIEKTAHLSSKLAGVVLHWLSPALRGTIESTRGELRRLQREVDKNSHIFGDHLASLEHRANTVEVQFQNMHRRELASGEWTGAAVGEVFTRMEREIERLRNVDATLLMTMHDRLRKDYDELNALVNDISHPEGAWTGEVVIAQQNTINELKKTVTQLQHRLAAVEEQR